MEHSELVQEMQHIEQLPLPERIKLNQKRRKQQIAAYAKWAKSDSTSSKPRPKGRQGVVFSPDVQLMEIAARGAFDEMKALLKAGVDPNMMNHDGLTALHQCCIDGSQEMVTLLLKYGADVNVTDQDLWTPLHAAATCGHFKIVTILLRAGANLTAINGDGDMPHDITEEEDTLQYLENELAKRGIEPEDLEEVRQRPYRSLMTDVNEVLANGGDLNQPLKHGETFLHVAIANGYNDIVRLLLQNGASVTVSDNDGWQPVHVAAYWCNEEVLYMLTESKKNIDLRAVTETGETPIELCEDPEFKLTILHKLSKMKNEDESFEMASHESSSGSRESLMASQESLTSFREETDSSMQEEEKKGEEEEEKHASTDYEDLLNVTLRAGRQLDQNVGPDIQDSSQPQYEEAPAPLPINIQAIELSSDRRNSIKEAKHRAPLKRHSSERLSNKEKRRAPRPPRNDHERRPSDASGSSDNIYDTTLMTSPSQDHTRENTDPHPSQTHLPSITEEGAKDRKQSDDRTNPQHHYGHNGDLPTYTSGTARHETNTTDINANTNTLVFLKPKKTPAPPPPKGSLLDLKRQRQELREHQLQNTQGGRSVFYESPEMFQPPPSPTTIRHKFTMVLDDDKRKKFIREKKCVIM